jgi:perosamine synthetase
MEQKFINQMEPWLGEEEKRAICDYMDEGGWLTEFKRTSLFENMIAEYTGAKHCIVVNNGTISLTLAAIACNIQAGDEVIVPDYTMIATPNSIKMLGAKPVFVDVEPGTLCMDLGLAKKAVTNRTKAVFLVTANGRYPTSGINSFIEFCDSNNLKLIEDAAQSLGSKYPDGRHQGTVGIVGSFSFSAPKIITTGQGGALITDDDEIAFKIRRLKDFGRSRGGIDIHDSIGYNFKFTEMQACIGVEQMKKLDFRVERKKEILKLYRDYLKPFSGISFFEQDLVNTTPWFIDILAENKNELKKYLKENGIGTRDMYPPINKQKAYNIEGSFPVADLVGLKGLWLPSSSNLTNENIEFISQKILEFYL